MVCLGWSCLPGDDAERGTEPGPEEATEGNLELRPETVDTPHEDVPRPSVPAPPGEAPREPAGSEADKGPGARSPAPQGSPQPSPAVARGRYLAERVAQCIVCHSPKDDAGRVLVEQRFQGAPIPVESPYPGQTWAVEAPAIAGLSFYTREEAVRLLTEGIARDGEPPRRPMPRFGMTREDAEAVFEFLRSLPRAP